MKHSKSAPAMLKQVPTHEVVKAAARLDAGNLVAFPTETVYGLGADAMNPAAVARIYATKGRPSNHPVIVHLPQRAQTGQWDVDFADLLGWTADVPKEAQKLIAAFWPGPLTLILPKAKNVPSAVSGGQDSIGVRCPSHPVAQQLLQAFAARRPDTFVGVGAPSANKFGHVSPTQAEHVRAEFAEEVKNGLIVLEGGDSDIGIESTIVDVSRLAQGVPVTLLRPGYITTEQLAAVLGYEPQRPDQAAPRASGTLKAHYAPHTALKAAVLNAQLSKGETVALMAHDPAFVEAWCSLQGADDDQISRVSMPADPKDYAHLIYAVLRQLDQGAYDAIYIQPVPEDLAWEGVRDRVGRALAAFS